MGDVIHGKHPPYKTSSNLIGNYSCFRNTEIQHLGKKWRKEERNKLLFSVLQFLHEKLFCGKWEKISTNQIFKSELLQFRK